MSRWLAAVTIGCSLLLWPGRASAQIEVPRGSVGVFGQLAQNTGQAGDAYRYAWLAGVNAGYEVVRASSVGISATWSLAGGSYRGAAEGRADVSVRVLEMGFGGRLRFALGKTTPRFVALGAGATILRLDRALPPDDERLYLGPYGSIGIEQYIGAGTMVSFIVRYGLIGTGPTSLGLRIILSWGS